MAKRSRPGQPPFEPNDQQRQLVQVLASNGISHKVIAVNVKCSIPTLRKYFREDLTEGFERVKAAMGASVVRAGLAGNMFAAKYWLCTHGGPEWRESQGRIISGTLEIEDATTEDLTTELEKLRSRQALAGGAGGLAQEMQDEPDGVLH